MQVSTTVTMTGDDVINAVAAYVSSKLGQPVEVTGLSPETPSLVVTVQTAPKPKRERKPRAPKEAAE